MVISERKRNENLALTMLLACGSTHGLCCRRLMMPMPKRKLSVLGQVEKVQASATKDLKTQTLSMRIPKAE